MQSFSGLCCIDGERAADTTSVCHMGMVAGGSLQDVVLREDADTRSR
jgi:hypothetical protein